MAKLKNKLVKNSKFFQVEINATPEFKNLCTRALEDKKDMNKAVKILKKVVKEFGDTSTWSKEDYKDTVTKIGEESSKGIILDPKGIYGGPELTDNEISC